MVKQTIKANSSQNGVTKTNWKKTLSKKELQHLKENGIHTLSDMKDQTVYLSDMRKKYPNGSEPCWECRQISQKLGLFDDTEVSE